jgi:hypothetical protein
MHLRLAYLLWTVHAASSPYSVWEAQRRAGNPSGCAIDCHALAASGGAPGSLRVLACSMDEPHADARRARVVQGAYHSLNIGRRIPSELADCSTSVIIVTRRCPHDSRRRLVCTGSWAMRVIGSLRAESVWGVASGAASDVNGMSKSERISEAIRFAAAAHSGQYRKGTGTPYVWHPLSVGRLLDDAGCSTDTIVAGILHDVLEDTSITPGEVRQRFGPQVSEILETCSVSDASLSWEIRRQTLIERLRTARIEAKIVSAADKLDNLRDTAADLVTVGEEVWERFNRGRKEHEWYYRNVLVSLTESSGQVADHPLVRALALEIDKVFGERSEVVAGCGDGPEELEGGAGGQDG